MMKHLRGILLTVGLQLLFGSSVTIGAQVSIFDRLSGEEVLELEIETDLVELIENRRRDVYQPAVLRYKDIHGKTIQSGIEVIPRGKFRRRICDFPPVKLKFSKKELLAAGLKPHNNLKLSTHCLSDKEVGSSNVFKELLAYKLYNILSPHSFRVQLVKVTYVDAMGQLGKIKRYGFLIEDDEELAERLGGNLCECLNAGTDGLSAFDQTLVAAFNYMIGNEDWSIPMVRNLKMVAPANGGKIIPIAYDFDFSGLVNAPYALPDSDLNQRHVKDRDYLGLEVSPGVFRQVIDRFTEKKPEIYSYLSRFKWLNTGQKEEIKSYLNSFYLLLSQAPSDAISLPSYRYISPVESGFSGN